MSLNETSNLTALRTEFAPGWVSEPDGRGTWSILYSCIFTILLCVWTAVHLNIPGPGESSFRTWVRKIKWVAIALFAPEIVLYTAVYQFWFAIRLYRDLNRWSTYFFKTKSKECEVTIRRRYESDDSASLQNQPDLGLPGAATTASRSSIFWRLSSSRMITLRTAAEWCREIFGPRERARFDLTYCFFVVMGGFEIDVSEYSTQHTRLILTPAGVRACAEQGFFFEMDSESIKDKNKSDSLAKILVILQVTWIVASSVGRAVVGLPLSLLEIHTMVHVVCAWMMYMLWFHKPKDVLKSSLVDPHVFENGKGLFADLLMRTRRLWQPYKWVDRSQEWVKAHNLFYDSEGSYIFAIGYKGHVRPDKVKHNFHIDDDDDQVTRTQSITYSPLSSDLLAVLPDHGAFKSAIRWDDSIEEDGIRYEDQRCVVYLSTQDALRWQLASSHNDHHKRPDIAQHSYLCTYMCNRMVNLSISVEYSHEASIRLRVWFGTRAAFVLWLVFLTSSYAAIHYTALSVHFPTYVEYQLWQASSLVFFGGGAIAMSYMTLEAIATFLSHKRRTRQFREGRALREAGPPHFCFSPLLWRLSSLKTYLYTHRHDFHPGVLTIQLFAWPLALVYIAARLYIVVEAFVSLRRVPLGVYTTVDWATYLPHF
ncbi:MAG: hypothetical protein Q9174_002700 [Haloplaca sp. 1 TL-2023]